VGKEITAEQDLPPLAVRLLRGVAEPHSARNRAAGRDKLPSAWFAPRPRLCRAQGARNSLVACERAEQTQNTMLMP
jgi:hypothetical protein